jgi:uncharacterized protein YqeY
LSAQGGSAFGGKIKNCKLMNPMTLKEQLMNDIKAAMKAGKQDELTTLRGLSSVLKNAEIAKQMKEGASALLTEEESMNVMLTESKKRKDSANAFTTSNKPDLAEKENLELAIVARYLPKQMTAEETAAAVEKIISESKPADFPTAMKLVMAALRGKADAGAITEQIKKKFGK